MLKLNKVKKVLENKYEEDGKVLSVEQKLQKICGVTEEHALVATENGSLRETMWKRTIDPQAMKDLDNICPAQFGREWVGPSFESEAEDAMHSSTFFSDLRRKMKMKGAVEDGPGPVSGSMMQPINTWGYFSLGLYDFKVLQGWQNAPQKYTEVMPTVPTLIKGAQKHLLSGYDGSVSLKPVNEGAVADSVGAKPVWVWGTVADEFQFQYSIEMEALQSDISGTLQSLGMGLGESLRKSENYRAFQYFFGLINRYCFDTRDGTTPSCNTFQNNTSGYSFNGADNVSALPFNFTNFYASSGQDLTHGDVSLINQAYLNMLLLTDPVRNWRLDLGKDFIFWCVPQLQFYAGEIIKLFTSYKATGQDPSATAFPSRLGAVDNPLMVAGLNFEIVDLGIEAYDVLAGTSTIQGPPTSGYDYLGNPVTAYYTATTSTGNAANAASTWGLLSKKQKFMQYEPWIPLRTSTYTLTGDDLSKRIGMRGDAYVSSKFYVEEPRACQMNNIGSTS